MAFKHREYAKFAAKRDKESDHPFGYLTKAEDVVKHYGTRLEGKTVVVTGANTGLGKETARVLATTGAEIVLAVRSVERGEAAVEDIRGEVRAQDTAKLPRAWAPHHASPSRHVQVENANFVVMHLDLGSLASVRSFAESYKEVGRAAERSALRSASRVARSPAAGSIFSL